MAYDGDGVSRIWHRPAFYRLLFHLVVVGNRRGLTILDEFGGGIGFLSTITCGDVFTIGVLKCCFINQVIYLF